MGEGGRYPDRRASKRKWVGGGAAKVSMKPVRPFQSTYNSWGLERLGKQGRQKKVEEKRRGWGELEDSRKSLRKVRTLSNGGEREMKQDVIKNL